MSRILLCTSYFWPDRTGIALYSHNLARHLAARGDDVTVVTGFPHYPSWRRPPGGRRLACSEWREGVRILRRWHAVPQRQTAGRRAGYEASFLLGATAVPAAGRPDVVVGVSPCLASAAVAAFAGGGHHVPVGLVFQDVVGLAAKQSGVRGGARLAGATGRLERAVARRATRVALTADGFVPFFLEGGVDPRRVVRLRNWAERAAPDRSPARARADLGWGASEFVCLHAGNMGAKQDLDTLLDAAALLRTEDGVRVVLAGDGHDRPRLQLRAAERRLANVTFADVQAPGAYEAMLEAADVLLVNQRASVLDMALPSKLTAYFAAGRPVLAAVAAGSETAAEVRRAGAGRIVAPGHPAAVVRALLDLRADGAERAELGARGRRYASEHLTREAVLARWAAWVDETREAARA